MKKTLLLFLLCITTFKVLSQAPTSGQVAFYPFNNNTNDESGNSRNGTASNITYTTDRFGVINKAAAFNATNSSLEVSSWNLLSGNATRTISIWFKTTGQTTSQYMLSWGANNTNQSSVVGNYFGSGSSSFGFIGYSTGLVEGFSGTCPYFDNQWHNVIFTHDGTTSKLFVDGVQKTSGANTFATGNSNLFIGNYFGSSAFFNGILDDIRLYNRALTTTEINQLYNSELPVNNNDIITLGATRFLHTKDVNNLAIGENSGISISTGWSNIFVGKNSGQSNSTGFNNILLGHNSGLVNTIGNHNIFLGVEAGMNNTSGQRNTFIGWHSGGENTIQNYNTYIGDGAGIYSKSEKNTFIGVNSGKWNDTGKENTFIGYQSGFSNEFGDYNTFIGSQANGKTNSIKRSTAIGYNAVVGIDDAIVLGDTTNPNIKVGIGVGSPKYRLDIKGVVNMSVGYNNPVIKINEKDFLAQDQNGSIVLSNFKLRYENENQWADNVFQSNYNLMPIEEVVNYTSKYKHLPNIPSAEEIIKKGLDITEIFPKILSKIEELTLYINQVNEENKVLRNRILELKSNK